MILEIIPGKDWNYKKFKKPGCKLPYFILWRARHGKSTLSVEMWCYYGSQLFTFRYRVSLILFIEIIPGEDWNFKKFRKPGLPCISSMEKPDMENQLYQRKYIILLWFPAINCRYISWLSFSWNHIWQSPDEDLRNMVEIRKCFIILEAAPDHLIHAVEQDKYHGIPSPISCLFSSFNTCNLFRQRLEFTSNM